METVFTRGEAFTRLESYAQVIALHLTLVQLCSDSQNIEHWNKGLKTFRGVLKRYDKAKSKAKHNFTASDIERTLNEIIESNEDREYLIHDVLGVEKGLMIDYQQVQWEKIKNAIQEFSRSVAE